MWTYNYSNELHHHGIKGQRWGVRNGPPYPLGTRIVRKIQKQKENTKSKRHLKLEERYQRKGMSEQDAEITAAKRVKIEKVIKATAAVTVAAATVYVASKIANNIVEKNIQENMKHVFDTAKNNGIMDISDLPRIKGEHGLLDDLAAVNPRYGHTTPLSKRASAKGKNNVWTTNCGYCATAFELRRRGFDVEAVSNGKGMTSLTPKSLFKDIVWKKTTPISAFNNIAVESRKWGEGARGIVHVGWKRKRGGHAYSFVVKNGFPEFIDAQTNDPKVLNYFNSARSVRYARVDNLELTDNILNAVKIRR